MRLSQEPAASCRKTHPNFHEKTIPAEHGSNNPSKILEPEQHSNIKSLQNKRFWTEKRTVLENQRVAVESRLEIASDRKK